MWSWNNLSVLKCAVHLPFFLALERKKTHSRGEIENHRSNWDLQWGLYVKLLLEVYDLDSEKAVHLSTGVWKVIIPSQKNGLKCGVNVKICVLFFTGFCKGEQYALVKFQCMVKVSFLPPRCLLGKGDLQTETNGKALVHFWMNVHSSVTQTGCLASGLRQILWCHML